MTDQEHTPGVARMMALYEAGDITRLDILRMYQATGLDYTGAVQAYKDALALIEKEFMDSLATKNPRTLAWVDQERARAKKAYARARKLVRDQG